MDPPPAPAPAAQPAGKKGKNKKASDPVNTSKQIEDTIAQLEKNKAGDREQEAEIEREVKRANREVKSMLDRLETPMTKLDALHKRYTELLTNLKRLERDHAKTKKRADILQKERDKAQTELNKKTGEREKLEKLSRDFQKDLRKEREEKQRLADTESKAREELHARLEHMTEEVQTFIDLKEHPENQPKNLEADEMFRQKFKSFVDQYELRELQFHALLRTKELEVQYQVARYEQQRKAQEQEANKSKQLTSQVSTFSQTETELRNQLAIYVEKFKQVEDTLNNSNDLFLTFRKEMEEMSKKTKRLEKENSDLNKKHAQATQSVYRMAEERAGNTKELDQLRQTNAKLEKLCRGMQEQGRGQLPAVDQHHLSDSEGTESEYDDEDEYDEEDLDDDTEPEPVLRDRQNGSQVLGKTSSAPPPTPQSTTVAGAISNHDRLNGVNGVKH